MTRLRKYYIKRREQFLNPPNTKFIRLIFNKDTAPNIGRGAKQILKTKQQFPKYLGNCVVAGSTIMEDRIEVFNKLGLYLRETPLNLIGIQIENKWYTGPLITKARFEQPMEQLLSLLLNRQKILKENNKTQH